MKKSLITCCSWRPLRRGETCFAITVRPRFTLMELTSRRGFRHWNILSLRLIPVSQNPTGLAVRKVLKFPSRQTRAIRTTRRSMMRRLWGESSDAIGPPSLSSRLIPPRYNWLTSLLTQTFLSLSLDHLQLEELETAFAQTHYPE